MLFQIRARRQRPSPPSQEACKNLLPIAARHRGRPPKKGKSHQSQSLIAIDINSCCSTPVQNTFRPFNKSWKGRLENLV
jgi:hypothetical protein